MRWMQIPRRSIDSEGMSLKSAILWLIVGLVLLIGASRLLVWGR
jgi:cation:H+ antiporter